jgi:thiamine biosynthesis lipoprotein
VLRAVWRFDGSDRVPTAEAVAALLPRVGFARLAWDGRTLTVPEGMEIDFGGIGKEYAVDRALALVVAGFAGAALVNFGGDLAASAPPASGPWTVGVERPGRVGEARLVLELARGGLATSGDTHRFIEVAGTRYGHILDVRSGWPVQGAPHSVSVAAPSCVEAGMLATLAMLKGSGAETFLAEQGVEYWCLR